MRRALPSLHLCNYNSYTSPYLCSNDTVSRYWHVRPNEGLSGRFDLTRLIAPQQHYDVEARRSAVESSQLSDWDWWVEQWQMTAEGGAQEHAP